MIYGEVRNNSNLRSDPNGISVTLTGEEKGFSPEKWRKSEKILGGHFLYKSIVSALLGSKFQLNLLEGFLV